VSGDVLGRSPATYAAEPIQGREFETGYFGGSRGLLWKQWPSRLAALWYPLWRIHLASLQ